MTSEFVFVYTTLPDESAARSNTRLKKGNRYAVGEIAYRFASRSRARQQRARLHPSAEDFCALTPFVRCARRRMRRRGLHHHVHGVKNV
jgi:hypothetical protein